MTIMIHYWSNDVEKVMMYYVEKLSFDIEHKEPSDGKVRFCILGIGDSKIMFAGPAESNVLNDRNDQAVLENIDKRIGRPGPVSVYIGVDDIDAYYERITCLKADIVEPIWDTPWRLRQFSTIDPDGNITTFFSE